MTGPTQRRLLLQATRTPLISEVPHILAALLEIECHDWRASIAYLEAPFSPFSPHRWLHLGSPS